MIMAPETDKMIRSNELTVKNKFKKNVKKTPQPMDDKAGLAPPLPAEVYGLSFSSEVKN